MARIAGLTEFPHRGASRDDIRLGLRTVPFRRRLTIAYAVTSPEVRIIRHPATLLRQPAKCLGPGGKSGLLSRPLVEPLQKLRLKELSDCHPIPQPNAATSFRRLFLANDTSPTLLAILEQTQV